MDKEEKITFVFWQLLMYKEKKQLLGGKGLIY